MELTRFEGRPEDESGRQAREIRVYDLLDELKIPYERLDHAPASTMEICRQIDESLGALICKNLFLCNRQKTQFFLLMLPSDVPFVTKNISKQAGSTRLSFAEPEYMEQYLDILPGSVSIMGLMNDHEKQVKLLVHEDVLKEEYLGCHPCVNTSSLRLRTGDVFETFLKAVDHDDMIIVTG